MMIDNKKMCVEAVNFGPGSTAEDRVKEGLDFILEHFSQPLFPRKVSTFATRNEQKMVDDSDRAMLYFQASQWGDCRIEPLG